MNSEDIPRTVKPRRKPKEPCDLPIIAIHDKDIWVERTQKLLPISELPSLVVTEPSSIFALHNAGTILAPLNEIYEKNPRWQYKLTPIERELYNPNGEKARFTVREVIVNFFGFSRPKGNHRLKPKYHYPLDPLVFCRKTAPEIRGRDTDGELTYTLFALYEWAKDVRNFIQEQELRLGATSGGIAAQLLRDSRFFPEPRRKVPAATNEAARARLPGNYYRLNKEPGEYLRAYYLDQENAHHTCALELQFPDPDYLYAKGNFDSESSEIWSHAGSAHFEKIIRQHGLFRLKISSPHRTAAIAPPYLETVGVREAYIYSNELPMFYALGGRVEGIIAAWTSPKVCKGLNRYARWAIDELKGKPPETREWLKPTLLSTYGLLASKPKNLEYGFRTSTAGEPKKYPVGAVDLPVMARTSTKAIEPGFANVIHRGMIESETRKRSIELANWLASYDLDIVGVYADSVFVSSRDNAALPLLPPPWGIKYELTGLRFFNPVSFHSRELTKMPGVPRELQERFAHKPILSQVEKNAHFAGSAHFSVRSD
jgi:hypothetical protein